MVDYVDRLLWLSSFTVDSKDKTKCLHYLFSPTNDYLVASDRSSCAFIYYPGVIGGMCYTVHDNSLLKLNFSVPYPSVEQYLTNRFSGNHEVHIDLSCIDKPYITVGDNVFDHRMITKLSQPNARYYYSPLLGGDFVSIGDGKYGSRIYHSSLGSGYMILTSVGEYGTASCMPMNL